MLENSKRRIETHEEVCVFRVCALFASLRLQLQLRKLELLLAVSRTRI